MKARDEFIAAWEAHYQDKYPFEPKDAAQLKAALTRHPQIAVRWTAMVSRYLGNTFYAELRHPLYQLATHVVEFAGETNGVHRLSKQQTQTISAAQGFVARGTK